MERNKRKDLFYRLFNIITLSFIFLVLSQSVLALQNHTGAHDPSTIVKDGDTYWIFTTGNGIYSMYSKDLIKWTAGKTPFPAGTFPSWIKGYVPDFQGHFWAPECVYMNGMYYLYYACSSWGSKNSCIGLATTKSLNPSSPDYEWKDQGMVVFSNNNSAANCIDPALFTDKDGKLWLSFGSYFGGIRFTELDSQTGKPLSSKLYAVASGNCEASYVILHGNYYYLFINRGSCCQGVNSTYHIQVGRSENPTGPFLDKYGNDLNSGGGTTILASQNNFIGPGCLGYYVEDGVEYTTYHYYDGNESGTPTLAIGTMKWDSENWPVITNNWLDEGTYSILNNNSNWVWATDQCLAGIGTPVVQSSYDKKNCQQWDLEQLGTGYYKIKAHSTNRVVMVGDCAIGTGAPLALGDYTGRECEIWRIERTNNNTFVLSSKSTNRVIDVTGASKDIGAVLQIDNYNGTDNQQWYFQDTAVAVGITPELEIGNDPWVVYPNPLSNTYFTVKGLDNFSSSQVRISIISLQGKVIFAKKYPVAETIQVDVDGIKPGSYMVRIQTAAIISQKQINIL